MVGRDGALLILAANIRVSIQPEAQHAAVHIGLSPHRRMVIVGINHRNTLRAQTVEYFAFGARYRFHRAQHADVCRLRVINQRHIRARKPRQIVDFADMVHAHFEYSVMMRCGHAQQHQRQTNVVIKVALGSEYGVHRFGRSANFLGRLRERGQRCSQNRCQHFLDRRFAIAPGDGNNRNGKTIAPFRCQSAQRQTCVVNADRLHHIGCLLGIQHHTDCASLQRLNCVNAPVKLGAAQRNE